MKLVTCNNNRCEIYAIKAFEITINIGFNNNKFCVSTINWATIDMRESMQLIKKEFEATMDGIS